MLQGHPLRDHERKEFHSWYRRTNGRRTLYVGLVMLVFAVVLAVSAPLGLDDTPLAVYLAYAAAIATGGVLIRTGMDREIDRLSYAGEVTIVGISIVWMFTAVGGRLHVGFGLAEFVIGTLALALLRYMRPLLAAVVFPGLSVLYGLFLWYRGVFEFVAWINSLVFAVFALIWSLTAFHGRIVLFRNARLVEELNRRNDLLTTLALKDALTGLPNRRYFEQMMERTIPDAASRSIPVALLLIDVDHFKRFNDRFGHPAGDQCLQEVGRALARENRPGVVALRLGGEEFAVVISTETGTDPAAFADRLRGRVADGGRVTISVGIAVTRPSGATDPAAVTDTLYRQADQALYLAKERGRNRVETLH